MIINFWQNIVSIHQVPLMEALSKHQDITVNLIVCKEHDEDRLEMGWDVKLSSNINLFIIDDIDISKFIQTNHINIVSGFFAYSALSYTVKVCKQKNSKIFIYSEGKDKIGLKGLLRILKDRLMWFKVSNYNIEFLAIGNKGVDWFERIGVPEYKIHKFGYFTKKVFYSEEQVFACHKRIVFVGRLLPSKGIIPLIEAFSDKRLIDFSLDIYGDGLLADDIINLIDKLNVENRVRLHGSLNNLALRKILYKYSMLVLPNTGDEGWGAVINEALQSGLKVLCSEKTGASCLIFKSDFGKTLKVVNSVTIANGILEVSKYKASRSEIISWSNQNISPEIAADHLIRLINKREGAFNW